MGELLLETLLERLQRQLWKSYCWRRCWSDFRGSRGRVTVTDVAGALLAYKLFAIACPPFLERAVS